MRSRSRQKLVAHAVNRVQILRIRTVVANLFAKLDDGLVKRPRRAVVIVAPDFVQQPVAGEHFTRMPVEKLKQFEFFRRQRLDGLSALELKFFGINGGGADLKGLLRRPAPRAALRST